MRRNFTPRLTALESRLDLMVFAPTSVTPLPPIVVATQTLRTYEPPYLADTPVYGTTVASIGAITTVVA